jgi:hypothetical protein
MIQKKNWNPTEIDRDDLGIQANFCNMSKVNRSDPLNCKGKNKTFFVPERNNALCLSTLLKCNNWDLEADLRALLTSALYGGERLT